MLFKERLQPAITVISLLLGVLLTACASNPPSRYQQTEDSGPRGHYDVSSVADATPKIEPRSRGGNKSPYSIPGSKEQYWVMDSALGYKATGLASWYGAKFHGHLTSNGEIYSMFGMTAAHKSLPIPTYVKVTNLNNGRHVIVRVNDRGPFHGERLIDLSYAAAVKLGYAKQGTALVRIEAIDPVAWNRSKPAVMPVVTVAPGQELFLQVGAFVDINSALRLKQRLQVLTDVSVVVALDQRHTPALHKVHAGPLSNMSSAQQLRELISSNGLGLALVLALPKSDRLLETLN